MGAVADSIFFPCPACGAHEGFYCTEEPGLYSQTQDGDPWCHTARTQLAIFTVRQPSSIFG